MEALFILLPVSLALALVIALVFILAVRSGQFDDLEGPAHRILRDDDRATSTVRDSGTDES